MKIYYVVNVINAMEQRVGEKLNARGRDGGGEGRKCERRKMTKNVRIR